MQGDLLAISCASTIAKHAFKHLVSGGKGSNKPKPKAKKKPAVNAETERGRALLIKVIKLLSKYELETARRLVDEVMPRAQPRGP
jgi:hypothetical protein